MIHDSQTNFLYLADTLPKMYPIFHSRLVKLLNELKIDTSYLPDTKDIWAVDYMPLQKNRDLFQQFTYRPDYLLKTEKDRKTMSDAAKILEKIGFNPTKIPKSDILLDGGNLVAYNNKAFICDKIFKENKQMEKNKLINDLKSLLELKEIYFLPQHKEDEIGHADGMVRFINEDTVIINDLSGDYKYYQKNFKSIIDQSNLKCEKIPYNPYKNEGLDATGIYINYLQIGKNIIVPKFNIDEDEEAEKRFKEIFPTPGFKVSMLESCEIAKEGGILNCISWNILR